jgi:DNA-binding NarL/FixJ family response regulator
VRQALGVAATVRRGDAVTGGSCPCGRWPAGDDTDGIRILVVDDHEQVRTTLSELLSDEDDLTVVGECADGSEAVGAASRLRPDVVLMDLSMPIMDGVTATAALRAAQPSPHVVVLTAEGTAARDRVAAAGAHALVPKGVRADALLRCLRAVRCGCGRCPYCL